MSGKNAKELFSETLLDSGVVPEVKVSESESCTEAAIRELLGTNLLEEHRSAGLNSKEAEEELVQDINKRIKYLLDEIQTYLDICLSYID